MNFNVGKGEIKGRGDFGAAKVTRRTVDLDNVNNNSLVFETTRRGWCVGTYRDESVRPSNSFLRLIR